MLKLNAMYLDRAINDPKDVLADARAKLKGVKFDTFIGTGLSGALVLPMLARSMRKSFAVVRKPDNSHSQFRIEGSIGKRWIFVDDLIASGDTFRRVMGEVSTLCFAKNHETELVGAYMYHTKKYGPAAQVEDVFEFRL